MAEIILDPIHITLGELRSALEELAWAIVKEFGLYAPYEGLENATILLGSWVGLYDIYCFANDLD